MARTGEFEVGDTTERRIPDDTGVFAQPRRYPRPSSMYPMTTIEDEQAQERESWQRNDFWQDDWSARGARSVG
jgi:hypothetical protein